MSSYTQTLDGNRHHMNLLVEGMHCPSCVAAIEDALHKQPNVTQARLNLSTKRLSLDWTGKRDEGEQYIALINRMGYHAMPFDPETSETQEKREEKFLLRCLAVAGFASGNLMLFSIPIWSSDSVEMGVGTLTFFHWIQILIAVPAVIWCGRPFYASAWSALKEKRANMDVPISVAVLLTLLMSLYETFTHGRHTYFDSAVMLLFFLLIGRYLEMRARGRARSAAQDMLHMLSGEATRIGDDGSDERIRLSEIQPGMTLRVAPGEKIGADGAVISGTSELDTSIITGETQPKEVAKGTSVFAGMMNLTGPLTIEVTKPAEHSLIAEIVKLMEIAEQGQARYVTLADRISSWYTPGVHALALATFLGWLFLGGVEWQQALLYAATVLIITCPCALGLAVPVVQVLASGKLMREGILLKSASALERLAGVTLAVFDKTGTLTLGTPELMTPEQFAPEQLQLAASLAAHSRHPLSQSLSRAYDGPLVELESVREVPGEGLEAIWNGARLRLGKRRWCSVDETSDDASLELWFAKDGTAPVRFRFSDRLRSDSGKTIADLEQLGISSRLLSGDRAEVVARIADEVGITEAEGPLTPPEKAARIEEWKKQGEEVLMVGDGLNDAPSLAAASVSMSPSTALDITQNAADVVFQGDRLAPVRSAILVARRAQSLVRENFALALIYNVIAIPIAVLGHVTPLIAAIAMSSSSLVVIANAMRLNLVAGQSK